jgi:hypothetical protein
MLWVFNGVDGRHEVGDGPVCLVGEEQCGWQRVIEVEDDRSWNRFWVRDKSFFRGQGTDRAERRIGICGFWKLASCGTEERRRRTEQDLSGGEGLDDDHGSATVGTAP